MMLIIMVSGGGDGVITSHILDDGNAVDGPLFTSVILHNCNLYGRKKGKLYLLKSSLQ